MKKTVLLFTLIAILITALPALSTDTNLISNGGFENGRIGWIHSGNDYVSVSTTTKKSGNNAVKISTDTGGNPWICQMISVTPNTEYEVTAFINCNNITGNGIAYKYEFYSDAITGSENTVGWHYTSSYFSGEENTWAPFTQTFKTPSTAYGVNIYIRLFGNGTMYVDDVTCMAAGPSPAFALSTEETIYYTEWGGNVLVTATDLTAENLYSDGRITFELRYNGNMVRRVTKNVSGRTATYTFPLSLLANKGKEYTVSMVAYTASGTQLNSESLPIYRYDRPEMLDSNGNVIINGEIFNPVIMYHNIQNDLTVLYDEIKYEGANTMLTWIGYNTLTSNRLLPELDRALNKGVKCIIGLYNGMEPAGSERNAAATIRTVELVKNHAAVLGYAIMDEPYGNRKDNNYTADLLNSYKIIRDIDEIHPIYVTEYSPVAFETTARYCDILAHDPYPGNAFPPYTVVREHITKAVESVRGKKPVYAVLQAFDYQGYFPTTNDIRHMWYQALSAGAKGIGYFAFLGCAQDANGNSLAMWETHLGEGLATFSQNEQADAFRYFSTASEYNDENILYRNWQKNGDDYVLVLNKTTTAQAPTVSISGVTAYSKAEVLCGAEKSSITAFGENSMMVSLAGGAAALYRVKTPSDTDILLYNGNILADGTESQITAERYMAGGILCIAIYKMTDNTRELVSIRTTREKTLTQDVPQYAYSVKAFCLDSLNAIKPLNTYRAITIQ